MTSPDEIDKVKFLNGLQEGWDTVEFHWILENGRHSLDAKTWLGMNEAWINFCDVVAKVFGVKLEMFTEGLKWEEDGCSQQFRFEIAGLERKGIFPDAMRKAGFDLENECWQPSLFSEAELAGA